MLIDFIQAKQTLRSYKDRVEIHETESIFHTICWTNKYEKIIILIWLIKAGNAGYK